MKSDIELGTNKREVKQQQQQQQQQPQQQQQQVTLVCIYDEIL